MRILTLCEGGNVRSVALARLLRKRGHEVISAGISGTWSIETLMMLDGWAELICPMSEEIEDQYRRMSGTTTPMCLSYVVGHDDFNRPDHPELFRILRALVDRYPPALPPTCAHCGAPRGHVHLGGCPAAPSLQEVSQ